MQTFLPVSDFKQSFTILDYRRLGKQRVEAKQIINSILYGTGWKNHPITKMWTNHVDALKLYHNLCIDEWVSRGYKNNMIKFDIASGVTYPSWVGREDLHASHRSNLLRKDQIYYSKFNWRETNDLPYVWVK